VPGSVPPEIGTPFAVLIGVFWSVPIHTTEASCGVKPAVQASLFWFSM